MSGRRRLQTRHMKQAILAFSILLSGCSTSEVMRRQGLTEDILFQLEAEDWGVGMGVSDWPARARSMGVPLDARPIRLREIRCRRSSGRLFECNYLVDYGRDGVIEGTYRRRYATVGKNNGVWSNDWIIVT